MRRLGVLFAIALALAGCAVPRRARAQFIGFTSPQTVTQTLAPAGTACTGAAQNFSVTNLGQTQHSSSLVMTAAVNSATMVIYGIDAAGNASQISDTAVVANTAVAALTASGFYPIIRITVTCAPGTASFTLLYQGTSSITPQLVGAYLRTAIDKTIFTSIQATVGHSATMVTPYGSSLGELAFNYSVSAPSGSTLTVTCSGVTETLSVFTFSLANVITTVQYFQIPATECPTAQVSYTSGGAGTTFSLEYIFLPPGNPTPPNILTPDQLGVNALTEPAAGTSALSNIIDTRGVKQATLAFSCTAGTVTVNVQTYAEDGTTALALVSPVSAVAGGIGTNAQLSIGSESNPSSNTGTLSTTAVLRFPQRALAFSFTNVGLAGFCTARLFLSY